MINSAYTGSIFRRRMQIGSTCIKIEKHYSG